MLGAETPPAPARVRHGVLAHLNQGLFYTWSSASWL